MGSDYKEDVARKYLIAYRSGSPLTHTTEMFLFSNGLWSYVKQYCIDKNSIRLSVVSTGTSNRYVDSL